MRGEGGRESAESLLRHKQASGCVSRTVAWHSVFIKEDLPGMKSTRKLLPIEERVGCIYF